MWFEFSYIVSFTTEVANDKTKFSNPIYRIYSLYPLIERTHPKVYGRTPPRGRNVLLSPQVETKGSGDMLEW